MDYKVYGNIRDTWYDLILNKSGYQFGRVAYDSSYLDLIEKTYDVFKTFYESPITEIDEIDNYFDLLALISEFGADDPCPDESDDCMFSLMKLLARELGSAICARGCFISEDRIDKLHIIPEDYNITGPTIIYDVREKNIDEVHRFARKCFAF